MQMQFDATTVEPNEGPGGGFPVSDDKGHLVIITAEASKPVKDKPGASYLEFELTGQAAPVMGQKAPVRLNLGSDSERARQIAWGEMSAIMHCVGVLQISDTQQLWNKPFRVIVEQQRDKDGKPTQFTQITAFRDQHGNKPKEAGKGTTTAIAAPAQPAAAAQPATGFAPGSVAAASAAAAAQPSVAPADAAPAPAWGAGPAATAAPGPAAAAGGAPSWGAPAG